MTPINIQVSRSKVKPILDKLGKGGISVSQTSIFNIISHPGLCHNLEDTQFILNEDFTSL